MVHGLKIIYRTARFERHCDRISSGGGIGFMLTKSIYRTARFERHCDSFGRYAFVQRIPHDMAIYRTARFERHCDRFGCSP